MPLRRWNIPAKWTELARMGLGALLFCLVVVFGLFFRWTAKGEQSVFSFWTWLGSETHQLSSFIFSSRSALTAERDQYQALAGTLAKEAADAATLREEIKNLEDALGYRAHDSNIPLAARITSRTEESEETISADQGSEEGVAKGDAVFIHDGHLVGSVEDIWPHSCRIRLIRDVNSRVPAAILGQETQTVGIVEGKGGYLLAMRFIPHDQPIAVGQVVITSGLDGHLPEGLVLGTVSEVIQEDRALFQEAMIEPIYTLDQETHVFILTHQAPETSTP